MALTLRYPQLADRVAAIEREARGDVRGVDRALLSCDDSNAASAITIERNGGILEDIRRPDPNSKPTRRYWIDLSLRPALPDGPAGHNHRR